VAGWLVAVARLLLPVSRLRLARLLSVAAGRRRVARLRLAVPRLALMSPCRWCTCRAVARVRCLLVGWLSAVGRHGLNPPLLHSSNTVSAPSRGAGHTQSSLP